MTYMFYNMKYDRRSMKVDKSSTPVISLQSQIP